MSRSFWFCLCALPQPALSDISVLPISASGLSDVLVADAALVALFAVFFVAILSLPQRTPPVSHDKDRALGTHHAAVIGGSKRRNDASWTANAISRSSKKVSRP